MYVHSRVYVTQTMYNIICAQVARHLTQPANISVGKGDKWEENKERKKTLTFIVSICPAVCASMINHNVHAYIIPVVISLI